MTKNSTSENEVTPKKAKAKLKKHHRKTVPIVWAVAVVFIVAWSVYHHEQNHKREQAQEALATANTEVLARKQDVATAYVKYEHDYADEGFFRHHLLPDSKAVDMDKVAVLSAVSELNTAQQAECKLTGQTDCPIVAVDLNKHVRRAPRYEASTSEHGWSVWQKLGIVTGGGAVALVTGETAVGVSSALAAGGVTTVAGAALVVGAAVVLPVVVIGGALWWAFH